MKILALALAALVAIAALPADSYAASLSCTKQEKRVKKACKGRKKTSKTCARRTNELNTCLEVVAENTPEIEVCLSLYKPVCGIGTDGKLETYSNSCYAALHATAWVDGECK